jgi:outer membrane murein-binding lipoprotein Lpp
MDYYGKNLVQVLLTIVVVVLLIGGCEQRSKYNKAMDEIFTYSQEQTKLVKKIDEQGREITGARNLVLEKTKQVEKQLKEIEELKSLEQKVIFRTKTKYDTLTIALHDTLIIIETDTIEAKRFQYHDVWLNMSANIVEDSVKFDSLTVFNKYNIEFGESRRGLFKKKEQMVYIRNENPHTKTTDVASFKLEKSPKWYQRHIWKYVGGGAMVLFLVAL